MLRIGQVIRDGFCGGAFGRDSFEEKRVEAIGVNWVVLRDTNDVVWLYEGSPEDLLMYTEEAK